MVRYYIGLCAMAGSVGWIMADLWKENKKLLAECSAINTFCVENDHRFVCDKQVLPDGRTIIVVTEKK